MSRSLRRLASLVIVLSSVSLPAAADDESFSGFMFRLIGTETAGEKAEKLVGAAQGALAVNALQNYQDAVRTGTATGKMAENTAKTAAASASLFGPAGAFLGAAVENVATDGSLQTRSVDRYMAAVLSGDSAAIAAAGEARDAAITQSAVTKSIRDPSVDALLSAIPGGREARAVGAAATLARLVSGSKDLLVSIRRSWPGALTSLTGGASNDAPNTINPEPAPKTANVGSPTADSASLAEQPISSGEFKDNSPSAEEHQAFAWRESDFSQISSVQGKIDGYAEPGVCEPSTARNAQEYISEQKRLYYNKDFFSSCFNFNVLHDEPVLYSIEYTCHNEEHDYNEKTIVEMKEIDSFHVRETSRTYSKYGWTELSNINNYCN